MATIPFHTGLDVLRAQEFAPFRGKRVGLVTHPAAVSVGAGGFRRADELFAAAPGVELAALFGPEHGLTGEAQDLIPVGPGGLLHGTRTYSLYGDTFDSLTPTPDMLRGLDVLVIDLQDVGARYYTFQATMLYCLGAAAAVGLPVVVLDRPNPLGGALVEGPTIRPGFESFVGPHPIPTRHGLTMGELARLYRAERVPAVDLTVIPCAPHGPGGRAYSWVVPPSPNMPGLSTAVLYPGMCLIEGTNLSEGRGTTRPFEYIGFPGVSPDDIADRLRREQLPGLEVVPAAFRPTFQKHANLTCGGVFLHVTDDSFRPVRTGLAVIAAFREVLGDRFRWRTERYEFVDHIPAIDLLFGSERERLALEARVPWREIAAAWETEEDAFRERRKPYRIYEN
jgi:uncharacterized protein YbbC (DUF1343 family)